MFFSNGTRISFILSSINFPHFIIKQRAWKVDLILHLYQGLFVVSRPLINEALAQEVSFLVMRHLHLDETAPSITSMFKDSFGDNFISCYASYSTVRRKKKKKKKKEIREYVAYCDHLWLKNMLVTALITWLQGI